MKKIKQFIILCALTTAASANSYAQDFSAYTLDNVESINLFDGSNIDVKKDVYSILFAPDRKNKIDYIELKEGTIIDSYDVEKVILNKLNGGRYHDMMMSRMGDGSGG